MAAITLSKKNNYFAVFAFITIISLNAFGCRDGLNTNSSSDIQFVEDKDITSLNFQQLGDGYTFNLKFKNVWLDDAVYKGKKIKIPIFQGESGNVRISQLDKKRKVKENVTIVGALKYYTKKGELRKTILECVKIYKGSLLKNIDARTPTIIGGEGNGLIIWYDFDYEGYPSSIMIGTQGAPGCSGQCRYIDDIAVNEDFGWFKLSIGIGDKSPFADQKEQIQQAYDEAAK